MKPDDPNIKWIEEPKLGLAGRMYLPLLAQGLTTTFKHLSKSLASPTSRRWRITFSSRCRTTPSRRWRMSWREPG